MRKNARANRERILAAAGVVAEDVTVDEFFVLVRGVGQAAATMPAAPVTLDRAIEIICRGLAVQR
jgi:Transcriptional regulator SbtR-like, C-terminal domain